MNQREKKELGVFTFKQMDKVLCLFSLLFSFSRLATPSVIQPYCWLLKFYKENKEVTNHAIVKMLHRVAVDLKTPSMLFQLSLFGSFQKILSDPAASHYKASLHFYSNLRHALSCICKFNLQIKMKNWLFIYRRSYSN